MIITVIAATRMYRSLVDIGTAKMTPPGSGRTVSEVPAPSGPVPLSRVEVSMTDHRPMSRSGGGSYITTDSEEPYKAHEVSFDVDVEK